MSKILLKILFLDSGLLGADVSCTLVVVILSSSVMGTDDKVVSLFSFPINFVITGENGPMFVEFSIDEDDVVSFNTGVVEVEDTNF